MINIINVIFVLGTVIDNVDNNDDNVNLYHMNVMYLNVLYIYFLIMNNYFKIGLLFRFFGGDFFLCCHEKHNSIMLPLKYFMIGPTVYQYLHNILH